MLSRGQIHDAAPVVQDETIPATTTRTWTGRALAYVLGVLIGLDVLVNAVFGGRPYSTISCRVGESINSGGWASRIRWPRWWIEHCEAAIYTTIV